LLLAAVFAGLLAATGGMPPPSRSGVATILSPAADPAGPSFRLTSSRPLAGGTTAGIEACCLPDGSCFDLPEGSSVCGDLLGGVLMGPGTSCFTTRCDGACCFPDDGVCLEERGWGECAELKGVFAGFGSDCEPVPCGLPRGACCLPDGTCVDDVSENLCLLSLGGTWRGAGSDCLEVTCCRGDVNRDGLVDFGDTLFVLSRWGVCSPALSCDGDLNGDDIVGFADITVVLANFGCD
jgi:hypothetical protein